jgi:ABC-2 type transport system permease protein
MSALIRKETLELFRDGRLWVVAVTLAALFAVALAFGFRQSAAVEAERRRAQATADEHFRTQEQKNPHVAAHYGSYVFKPRSALPFVDPGVDPFVGVSVKLEAHRRGALEGARAKDSTSLARFGRFTVALVLQLLVPLLIIGLGFSAWTAERERGTLRLLATSGTSRGVLLAGKLFGTALALALLALPVLALGAAAVLVFGDGVGAILPGRVALLVLAYLGYFGVFLALTLGVSAVARSSRAALVTLLGIWVGTALVAPRVAADAAALWHPVPSTEALSAAVKHSLERGLPGGPPREERVGAITESLLEAKGYKGAETLMDAALLGGLELEAEARFENEVIDHHFGKVARAIDRQERAVQWAAVVAPPVAIRSLSMALSGTDYAHHAHFAEAAERYRRELVDALNQELATKGGADVWSYTAGSDTWARMPRFAYSDPGVKFALAFQGPSLVLLAGWLVASLAFAVAAARRTRVV